MKMLLIIALTTLFILKGADSQCLSHDHNDIPMPKTFRELHQSKKLFTIDLFRKINEHMSTKNVLFSPDSIYDSLLLTYFTASGTTESRLKEALKFNINESKIAIVKANMAEKFTRGFEKSQDYDLITINKIYVDHQLHVRECILILFGEEIEELDMRNSSSSALNHINTWVHNQTNGHIGNVLHPCNIDNTTRLLLVNAKHFKGQWALSFDRNRTTRKYFNVTPNKKVQVQMMRQTGLFRTGYLTEMNVQILEMPYKGDHVSMYILLPDKNQDINKMVQNITSSILTDIIESELLQNLQITIEFPKITMKKRTILNDILNQIGLNDLFDENSDLGFLTEQIGVHFSNIIHMSKIQIYEQGDSGRNINTLEQSSNYFICDRPFVYFIFDKSFDAITFMGIFRNPKDLS